MPSCQRFIPQNVNVLLREEMFRGSLAQRLLRHPRFPLNHSPELLYILACKQHPSVGSNLGFNPREPDILPNRLAAQRSFISEDSAYIGNAAFPVVGYVGLSFPKVHV